jgi:hypothetical protein
MNGQYQSTITQLFTVQAPKAGTFTIGPARVNHQGKVVESNTLALTITPPEQSTQTRDDSVSAKLVQNKTKIVVGEPLEVTATIRSRWAVAEAAMGNLENPDFTTKEIGAPLQRSEIVNGREHTVLEKKFQLTPHKAGIFTLGPIRMDIAIIPERSKNTRGGLFDESFFNDFFGNRPEVMHLQSNAITITVQPLPSEQIDSVGLFTSYKATISASDVAVNEPVKLSLDLEGTADFDHIGMPKLVLPRDVKYYDSKNETVPVGPATSGANKKHFEFIVQVGRAGSIEIPAQTYTYYDYHDHQIKKLQTQPLLLNVSGEQASTKPSMLAPSVAEKNPTPAPEAPTAHAPAKTDSSEPLSLPWWLFTGFLLLPLFFVIRPAFNFLNSRWHLFCSKQARANATTEQALKALVKTGDSSGIYTFFVAYVAKQIKQAPSDITMDTIESFCLAKGLSQEKIDEFIIFLGQCSSDKYDKKHLSPTEQEVLLKRAHYWFLTLQS